MSCCRCMLGFHFAFLGNNEIHVQECRGDFITSCSVMLLDSDVDTVIHDLGAGEAEAPQALCPSEEHCTATLGTEACSILVHVVLLQGQVSLLFRI